MDEENNTDDIYFLKLLMNVKWSILQSPFPACRPQGILKMKVTVELMGSW